jgi:hypothetical protein
MVKSAQRRILISSLYIGTEEESLVRRCCQYMDYAGGDGPARPCPGNL